MKEPVLPPETEVAVWLRILHPEGKLTPSVARAILRLTFPETERDRMHDLSAKARAGSLTPAEDQQMEAYERAGALLSILKSKARQVLKNVPRSA